MSEITLIICRKCDHACEMSREGDTILWTCPNCGEVRSWFWSGGEIDLEAIRTIAHQAYGDEFTLFTMPEESEGAAQE